MGLQIDRSVYQAGTISWNVPALDHKSMEFPRWLEQTNENKQPTDKKQTVSPGLIGFSPTIILGKAIHQHAATAIAHKSPLNPSC